jgi:hypothetical protein
VASLYTVTLLRAILENNDLGAFDMVNHRGVNTGTLHEGHPYGNLVVVHNEKYILQRYLLTSFYRQSIHLDGGAFDGSILFATAFNNCILHFGLQSSLRRRPCAILRLAVGKLGKRYTDSEHVTAPAHFLPGLGKKYYTGTV